MFTVDNEIERLLVCNCLIFILILFIISLINVHYCTSIIYIIDKNDIWIIGQQPGH